MPIKSFLSDLNLSRETLAKKTMEAMERFGDKVALIDPVTDKKVTFQQLREESIQVALKLRSIGVRKGDVVGIILNFNSVSIPLVIGLVLCKATIASCNIHNDISTLAMQLDQVEAKFCFVDESVSADITKNVRTVMTINEIDAIKILDEDTTTLFDTGDVDVMQDPLFLFFTSGSTGVPKIVEMTNFGMVSISSSTQPLPGDVRITVCSPMHLFGVVSTFVYAINGVQHVITASLSPVEFNQFISKYGVNVIAISNGSAVLKIFRESEAPPNGTLQCIITTGASVSADIIQSARRKFGVHINSAWGSTEASGITDASLPSTPASSVGYLLPNIELKVIDVVSEKELGSNENGELCVRSPYVMKGYYKQPLETAKVIDENGWVHTGDFGHYDEKGFIYIVDRIKDIIKANGTIAVFPAELEAVLLSHPGVVEAAVVKVDHPTYIEAPKAFVVKSDQDLTEGDLLSFYNSRVAEFKQLHGGLEFINEIPKISIGKPFKRALLKK